MNSINQSSFDISAPFSVAEAEANYLWPLSEPCDPVSELWILLDMAADMSRARIRFCLVQEAEGISIWRDRHGCHIFNLAKSYDSI